MNIQEAQADHEDERSYSVMTDTFSYSTKHHFIKSFKDPITCYNLVVHCYNNEVNRIGDQYLLLMEQTKLVSFVDPYLQEPLGILVLISIFILLPLLNLIFYIIIIIAMSKIIENEEYHRINIDQVPDPFTKMVYSEDMCETLGKSHWFLDIKMQGIKGLEVNPKVLESLQSRVDRNSQVKFMIYNRKFKLFFTEYPRVKYRYISWVAGLGIILILQILLITQLLRSY